MSEVFITGGTGNIGSRVIKDYLERTESRLHLLIRGESNQHIRNRVESVFKFWSIDYKYWDRVNLYPGDISKERFGLDHKSCTRLKEKVTHVLHTACNVRHDMTEAEAQTQIVRGTKSLYTFFKSGSRFQRFGFVSTLEIIGNYSGLVPEDFMSSLHRQYFNTYESAKSAVEDFLETEVAKGNDILVFRPSLVIGDTETGKINHFQSFYLMLNRLILFPPFPFVPPGVPLDVVPVNVLSKGIVELMQLPSIPLQRVFNFCPGLNRVGFFSFAKMVKSAMNDPALSRFRLGKYQFPYYLPTCVYEFGLDICAKIFKDNREIKLQKHFISFLYLNPQIESRRTLNVLLSHGVIFPKLESYLVKIIQFYLTKRLGSS